MDVKISKNFKKILHSERGRKQLLTFLLSHKKEGIIEVENDKKFKIIRGF